MSKNGSREVARQCFRQTHTEQEVYLAPSPNEQWSGVRLVGLCKVDSPDPFVARCVTGETDLFNIRKVAIFEFEDPCGLGKVAFTELKPYTSYTIGSG